MKSQPKLAQLLQALFVPEEVFALLGNRHVGVHAAAVYADDRLRQERRRHAQAGRDLAAEQLVELDLVGGGDDFAVAVVDLKLRGRDLGVVLLVFEAKRALHFGGGVDEGAQRVAGQRVVIAAGVHIIEPCRV